MLEFQLKRIGVFGAEETISSHLNFDERYKICQSLIFVENLMLKISELITVAYVLSPFSMG